MAGDVHLRLTMLRYLEQKSAGLLRHVVADEPGLDKGVSVELCSAFDDHERHAEELNAILRDAGEQGLPVPASFARDVDERIARVGASRTKEEVIERLAALEIFAVEQYHLAMASAGPEAHDALLAQLLDEQRHAQVLGAKAQRT